jgi:hypothetical protein
LCIRGQALGLLVKNWDLGSGTRKLDPRNQKDQVQGWAHSFTRGLRNKRLSPSQSQLSRVLGYQIWYRQWSGVKFGYWGLGQAQSQDKVLCQNQGLDYTIVGSRDLRLELDAESR